MPTEANRGARRNDRAAQIYRKLKGARGLDDDELWQHALFFAMTPEERCQFSLKTARSALSLRPAAGLGS
jgi:hypothetical protein